MSNNYEIAKKLIRRARKIKRPCMKCKKMFKTTIYKRTCSVCDLLNNGYGLMAEKTW